MIYFFNFFFCEYQTPNINVLTLLLTDANYFGFYYRIIYTINKATVGATYVYIL